MIPRENLPQISKDKIADFVKFAKKQNVPVKLEYVRTGSLKPIQKSYNKKKILDMMDKKIEIPLLISKEGFIVDGHHRAMAELLKNHNGDTACLRFDCPVGDLIRLGHKFDGSTTKTVNELRT